MKRNLAVRQQGEIYDIQDLQLAPLELNRLGFDLYVSADGAKRLEITCKKTQNRFVVEGVGHNW